MKFEHNNISPLDSRYAEKIVPIREAFSEKALIKTRFIIEINWLLFLCNKIPNDFPKLSKISINKILKFRDSFSDKDVLKIKPRPNFFVISFILPAISKVCCSVSSWQGPAIIQIFSSFEISIFPQLTLILLIYDFWLP